MIVDRGHRPAGYIFDLKCAKYIARVACKSPSWIARDVIDPTVLDLQTAHVPVAAQIGQADASHS